MADSIACTISDTRDDSDFNTFVLANAFSPLVECEVLTTITRPGSLHANCPEITRDDSADADITAADWRQLQEASGMNARASSSCRSVSSRTFRIRKLSIYFTNYSLVKYRGAMENALQYGGFAIVVLFILWLLALLSSCRPVEGFATASNPKKKEAEEARKRRPEERKLTNALTDDLAWVRKRTEMLSAQIVLLDYETCDHKKWASESLTGEEAVKNLDTNLNDTRESVDARSDAARKKAEVVIAAKYRAATGCDTLYECFAVKCYDEPKPLPPVSEQDHLQDVAYELNQNKIRLRKVARTMAIWVAPPLLASLEKSLGLTRRLIIQTPQFEQFIKSCVQPMQKPPPHIPCPCPEIIKNAKRPIETLPKDCLCHNAARDNLNFPVFTAKGLKEEILAAEKVADLVERFFTEVQQIRDKMVANKDRLQKGDINDRDTEIGAKNAGNDLGGSVNAI